MGLGFLCVLEVFSGARLGAYNKGFGVLTVRVSAGHFRAYLWSLDGAWGFI